MDLYIRDNHGNAINIMSASERVVMTSTIAGLSGSVQNSSFILISRQVILKFRHCG